MRALILENQKANLKKVRNEEVESLFFITRQGARLSSKVMKKAMSDLVEEFAGNTVYANDLENLSSMTVRHAACNTQVGPLIQMELPPELWMSAPLQGHKARTALKVY